MGIMLNTCGYGSGHIREVSEECDNEDKKCLQYNPSVPIAILNLWVKYGMPKPQTDSWKNFVSDVHISIL